MSAAQRGSIVAGIWLVSRGAVFLVLQAMDVPEIDIQGGVGSVRVA